uniref:Aromatic-L-amino-acid decarboxylase n=1 Tax=Meloidogyne javanica TaxID=6303 RepID=A0A915MS76_MELJA
MDVEAFRKNGKELIDIVADYWESLDTNKWEKPLPDIKPGFLQSLIPEEAPEEPESWQQIFADIEPVVLNGNTHWHHPNFFAYFSTACSYAGVMGDILSSGIASIGFTWKSSPSMTELEMVMTDWLAKAIGLPHQFWNSDPGPGVGMIQSTASDATLVALLAARARAVKKLKSQNTQLGQWEKFLKTPFIKALGHQLSEVGESLRSNLPKFNGMINGGQKKVEQTTKNPIGEVSVFEAHDSAYFDRLVAYCSDQAHSSVDKGIMLIGVKIRKLPTSKNKLGNFSLEASILEKAINEDRSNGLIPFILIITVGTTNTCAVESIRELGPVCEREGIWVHVDAAYAGSFLLCEEFAYLADGVEFADSFNFNAHKAMMINFDCSPMWFKNGAESISYFNVDPAYLKHEYQAVASDYRHLQIALGRRFRSLKIWFVLRAIGIKEIKQYLRKQVELAKLFAELLLNETNGYISSFELFVPPHLGLVCFRLKGSNELNEALLAALNTDGRIHLVASKTHGTYFLRFAICSSKTTEKHVHNAVELIKEIAEKISICY